MDFYLRIQGFLCDTFPSPNPLKVKMFHSLSSIAKIPRVSLISGTITLAFIFHLSIPFFRGYLQPKIHSETALFLRLSFSVLQHDFDDFCRWKDCKFLQNPPEFQWEIFLRQVTDKIESEGVDRLIVLFEQWNSSCSNSAKSIEIVKSNCQGECIQSDEDDDNGADKKPSISLSDFKFLMSEHEYKIRLHCDAYKNILFYKTHQLRPLKEFNSKQLTELKESLQTFIPSDVKSNDLKYLLEEKIPYLDEMIRYKEAVEHPDRRNSTFMYSSVANKMEETMGTFVTDISDLFKCPTAKFNEEYYEAVEHLFMQDKVRPYILSKNESFLQIISKIEDFLNNIDLKQ